MEPTSGGSVLRVWMAMPFEGVVEEVEDGGGDDEDDEVGVVDVEGVVVPGVGHDEAAAEEAVEPEEGGEGAEDVEEVAAGASWMVVLAEEGEGDEEGSCDEDPGDHVGEAVSGELRVDGEDEVEDGEREDEVEDEDEDGLAVAWVSVMLHS
jgi:hypothetical protein